jgi:glycosyltransferase involved in cell wall biosynthesis
MDLAPCFVSRPYILRHPGYNLAYWNLLHRQVSKRGSAWIVNGRPLVFFHFSGINIEKSQFSRHQNRFPDTTDGLGAVAQLSAEYRERVVRNCWDRYKSTSYAYATFSDGRPIEDAMRRWLARAIDAGRINPRDSLHMDSEFFDVLDEDAKERNVAITRFMYQFWLDRKDLNATFNIYVPKELDAYFSWFLGEAASQGVDGRTVEAAARLRSLEPITNEAPAEPVWPAITTACWDGPAAGAGEFLVGDIKVRVTGSEFLLPRQAALLWERRQDLQRNFSLDTLESLNLFTSWFMTQGVAESSIDISLFSDRFLAQISQLSDLTSFYGDVPITSIMLMTRDVRSGRDLLESTASFPVERVGRLAHGLWATFIASKLYDWPREWTGETRRYFDALSSVSVDGLRLTRGTIAIWELHPALQRAFPLDDEASRWAYLSWLIFDGLSRLNLNIDEFDERLRVFLALPSPRISGVSRVVEMVYTLRSDLRSEFDMGDAKRRIALNKWADSHIFELYPHLAAKPSVPSRRKVLQVTLVLSGYWSSPSGRGEDLRCSVEALKAVGFSDYCIVDLGMEKLLRPDGTEFDAELRAKFNICHVNADTAVQDWLKLRSLGVIADRAIGYWAWELEWLPSYWRHAFSFYDEIWASTRFAAVAFQREDLRPVKLVPMAVVAPDVGGFRRDGVGITPTTTLFLSMFDFRSYTARKNPKAVIQAFLQAFPQGDEDATLLLKTSGASQAPRHWQSIQSACQSDRRIRVIDTDLSRADIGGLIASADAVVSLHRSEGFGRVPAEAMLLNVPVIVTDYSGTTDFAGDDCALLVGYSLVPVRPSDYPGVEGQRWAEPDIDQAARHMRGVYENPAKAKILARKGRKRIESSHNTRIVGQGIVNTLGLRTDTRRVRSTTGSAK